MSFRARFIAFAVVAAVLGTPLAVAGTGDNLLEGVRNPSRGEATSETQIIASTGKDTYGTRQSNLGEGGGAIYGCRSTLDTVGIGDPKRSTPCVRINNLSTGKAFDFQATSGPIVGVIQAGNSLTTKHDDVSPFITNATGLAFGLNADRLDSLDSKEIIALARAKKDLDAEKLSGLTATELVNLARTKTGLDADTVDGLDSTQLAQQIQGESCPDDTTAAGGGCIEKAPRAAQDYAGASSTCGTAGRRLVPPNVLLYARTVAGIDLGAGEMSADITASSVAQVTNAITQGYVIVSDGGMTSTASLATATAFRCITR